MIISHDSEKYKKANSQSQWNGAYYYSKEIVENIIPRIKTDRNWVTINCSDAADHSIVFIHNNLHPEHYDFLKNYRDLILVVGVPETASKVAHLGKTIYLPLSVDIANVEKYMSKKEKPLCFVGRPSKFEGTIATGDYIGGVPREQLLRRLAKYENAYAVGRCAIEARVLGCNILPYDSRFPDPSIWKIFDNEDAAKCLQRALREIRYKEHIDCSQFEEYKNVIR